MTVPAAVVASAVAALAGWPSPLEATAEQVMEWTPVRLAEFLLFHLGSVARPAALIGALAVSMVAGGVAGALHAIWGRRPLQQLSGTALSTTFLLLIFLYAIRPGVPATAICFVALMVGSLTIISVPRPQVSGRREFLEHNALVLGGIAVLLTLFSVHPLLRALAVKRFFAFRPPGGLPIAGLTPLVTPVDTFYQMDKVLQFPSIGPPGWTLTIDGRVDKPLSVDYGTLLSHRHEHRYVTMECVDNPIGGPLMSTALFTGVPVADLLRLAGARGDTVAFHSADDYTESTARRVLDAQGALIAYAMNGERLPRAHGYPARLVLPGIYGFKSVKWLTRMEVVQGPYAGNWHAHGWTETARIHTLTRIDVARREGEWIVLAGVAFAGTRGISAVEVRANGGPWRRATLGPALGKQTWVQWAIRLAGQGKAHMQVRAVDGDGHVQTPRVHGAYPDGSTGWASTEV